MTLMLPKPSITTLSILVLKDSIEAVNSLDGDGKNLSFESNVIVDEGSTVAVLAVDANTAVFDAEGLKSTLSLKSYTRPLLGDTNTGIS